MQKGFPGRGVEFHGPEHPDPDCHFASLPARPLNSWFAVPAYNETSSTSARPRHDGRLLDTARSTVAATVAGAAAVTVLGPSYARVLDQAASS